MHLKALELIGFKSFGKKTTLSFTQPITSIVGPNGSGKCVDGSTLVQLATGERISIQELVARAKETATAVTKFDDGAAFHAPSLGIRVASVNPKTLKVEWKEVEGFVERTAPEEVLTISTRAGRTITATPYHPFFTFLDGEMVSLRADEVKRGVRIATPRAIDVETITQEIAWQDVLRAFTKEDLVYVPSNQILDTISQKVEAAGGATAYARTCGVESSVVQRAKDGQSLNVVYATKLLGDEAIFSDRRLVSKTGGTLRVPSVVDEQLARFLGYFIAEGRNNVGGSVWFVNEDEAVIKDYSTCVKASFDLTPKVFSYKEKAKDVILFSKTLGTLLDRMFGVTVGGGSAIKRVPQKIFSSPRPVIAAFLSALFTGDGYLKATKKQSYIEYASASEGLARDVSALLLRLGVVSQVVKKRKCASNTESKTMRTYWSVFIYGNKNLRILGETLSIVGVKRKSLAFYRALPDTGNPNHDLVPGMHEIVRTYVSGLGISVKKVRKEYPTLAAYYERRCETSRDGLARVRACGSEYGSSSVEMIIDRAIHSDVLWDEVVSVVHKKGSGFVYDLTVRDNHNFVANECVAHNSNVAEAFRFALGEQSIKSLRGKRGEDLIFSGSAQTPRSNKASVKVTFDNSDKLFNVDFSEVSIERTVFRDGINEYSINGSKVRLKDVHELLAHANIGQSGHHIISQGEADRILSSNPKERRNMIEEALGLRVYKYKKEEAEKKLLKTEENIGSVEGLRKEIAPHLRFLKKQVEKVERAKELKDELVEKYKEYFAKEEAWLSSEEKKNKEVLAEPAKRLREIQEEIKSLPEDTPVDTSEFDTKIERAGEELRSLEQESQEALQKLSRVEGALELTKKNQTGDERILISADTFSEFKAEVLQVFEHGERADSFATLRRAFDSLVRAVRPFVNAYGGGVREVEDTSDLEREFSELKKAYEFAQTKVQEAQEALFGIRKEREEVRNKTQEGQIKRLALSAEEARLAAITSSAKERTERLRVEREEFEREHQEALVLIGEAAVRYEKIDWADEDRSVQENRKRDIERMKIRVEELGGGGDEILKEFTDVQQRDEFLEKEIEDLYTSASSLKELIGDLERELTSTFNEGLVAINKAFNEFFITMFGGGSARLVAAEGRGEEDGVEDIGIDVSVSVPGKRVKGLMALSGGERALTSIALIFAMSQVNPPPFLILDETDAALDEANSRRYADMIENLAKRSQLILITHNRETMSRAGVLYGVTMLGDGISKLLSIQFEEAVQVAK